MTVKFTVTFTNNEAGAIEPFHFTQYAGDGTANSSFDLDRTGTANSRPTDTNALTNARGYIRFKQFQRHLAQLAPSHSLEVTSAGLTGGEVGKSVPADIALAGLVSTFTATVEIDNIDHLVDEYVVGTHGAVSIPTGANVAITDWTLNNPATTAEDSIVRVPLTTSAGQYVDRETAGKVYRQFGAAQTNDTAFHEQDFVAPVQYGLRFNAQTGQMERFEEEAAVTTGWIELPEFSAGYTALQIGQAAAVLSFHLSAIMDSAVTEREAILVEVDTARDWEVSDGATISQAPRAYVDMRDVTSAASADTTIVFTQFWR